LLVSFFLFFFSFLFFSRMMIAQKERVCVVLFYFGVL